ncbi:hypothetical protein [Candidatus Thiosymbion oneisti]|uniref:hypothetical protein n=1 Tax=Candidatus Thiosymbion oneisti TaxID=589554 RepID=UPI000B8000D0|nr:hypothetical protein [Candidatus Thiosymbion oneisti]
MMKQLKSYILAATLVVVGTLSLSAAPSAQASYRGTVLYSELGNVDLAVAKWYYELSLIYNNSTYRYYTYLNANRAYSDAYNAYRQAPSGSTAKRYAGYALNNASSYRRYAYSNYIYGGRYTSYKYQVARYGYLAQYYLSWAGYYAA